MNRDLEIMRQRVDKVTRVISHITAWIVVLSVVYCIAIPIAAVFLNWSASILITRIVAGVLGFGFTIVLLGVILMWLGVLKQQI